MSKSGSRRAATAREVAESSPEAPPNDSILSRAGRVGYSSEPGARAAVVDPSAVDPSAVEPSTEDPPPSEKPYHGNDTDKVVSKIDKTLAEVTALLAELNTIAASTLVNELRPVISGIRTRMRAQYPSKS